MHVHSKARQALHLRHAMPWCVQILLFAPYKNTTGFFNTGLCDGMSEWRTAAPNNFINQDNNLLSGEDGVKVSFPK